MRVCDTSGNVISSTELPDETAIDSFLSKHLISGDALVVYKQELIQAQQMESRLEDAVRHCVREQDINEMVKTVMQASIARLEQRDAPSLRSRLSERFEALVRKAFREYETSTI